MLSKINLFSNQVLKKNTYISNMFLNLKISFYPSTLINYYILTLKKKKVFKWVGFSLKKIIEKSEMVVDIIIVGMHAAE